MAERLCQLGGFKRVGHFEAKFLAEGLRFLYNLTAGSFHTEKHCRRLYSIEIEFYFFKSLFSNLFFGGDLEVTYALHLARWKARGRLHACDRRTDRLTDGQTELQPLYRASIAARAVTINTKLNFFAISYSCDVISGNLSKSAFFEGVGHFECKLQTEWDVTH